MNLPPLSEPLYQEAPLIPGMIPQQKLPLIHAIENNGHKKRGLDDHDKNTQPRGPTTARTMENPRKAYAREVLQIIGGPSKKARIETIISFNDDDLEGIKFPHDDPLVIMPVIGNSSVKRVLVDGGALVDILFHEAFIRMGYNDSQLTPSNMPIYGFNGIETKVEGIIELPMTMGQEPYEVTQLLNFLVVKAETSYNAISGRT